MVGALLWRGMLVGVAAGLLCFGFLKLVGEPPVDAAIAFEARLEEAKAHAGTLARGTDAAAEETAPELVSRDVQAGLGLLTGVTVYGAALGGLFALAFVLALGRIGDFSPRATAALLAVAGFVAVYLVPMLKYPPNPPAVGEPGTIGIRTALYFSMIALSIVAMVGAAMIRARLRSRLGAWNAALIAGGTYLITMVVAGLAMPMSNEIPPNFPAVILWQFRIASIGAQLLLWTGLGLGLGAAAEGVCGAARGFDHRHFADAGPPRPTR